VESEIQHFVSLVRPAIPLSGKKRSAFGVLKDEGGAAPVSGLQAVDRGERFNRSMAMLR
jgi:hypothetical protein